LQGLVEMHRENYHHRDLKPANILVTEDCYLGIHVRKQNARICMAHLVMEIWN